MTINGRQVADEVLEGLKKEVAALRRAQGEPLRLAAVLVYSGGSEGLGLKKFVELKEKAAKSIGVGFKSYFFDENISEDDLKKEVEKISVKQEINGVFIELPLPPNINPQNILDAIPAGKDLDVLSKPNQDKFFVGDFRVLPPAVESVRVVFEKYNINLVGKKVAVFGYGFLIGKPISYWLSKQGAEASIIRSKTENPAEVSARADIIISGVGKPGLITGNMIKEGAIIIDFGYGKKDGKMVGDVDFESVSSRASLITPVPGGMGPVLIAVVLKNLVLLNS